MSNEKSIKIGEYIVSKYEKLREDDFDNGIVIDLDETIEFSADAIIGNGFAPFEFS